jgi:hypothetical protein
MALRICPYCLTVEDILPDQHDFCKACLAQGHNYRMFAAWEFDRSRENWSKHPIPEVVQIAHAALDAAERRLAEVAAALTVKTEIISDLSNRQGLIT